MYKHNDDFCEIAKLGSEPLCLQPGTFVPVAALTAKHRDAIHKAHARWLCKRKRVLSLPQDKEYKEIWQIAMRGAYTPPDHKNVLGNVLILSAEGTTGQGGR
eukprot:scaffold241579_cov26-Tisochrysis_lutea.AAC.1